MPRPVKLKSSKAKAVKPKPAVSGSTGIYTGETADGKAMIQFNAYRALIPTLLLPVGAKAGDSVICRFQLVKNSGE